MKEILLIGNGPSAADYKMGKAIDAFPYVARFNTFRIHGFKEYVGKKCDVWITCDRFPQWQGQYDYKEIYFVSPVRHKVNPALLKFRTEMPKAKPFPDLVWDDVFKIMGTHPSSGALAAYYFSKSYDRVYLYGFDCFQADRHHYGDSNDACHHKAENERAFINKLLDEGVVRWFNNYTYLHDRTPAYGTGGAYFAPKIAEIAQENKVYSILDFGCGKGGLVRELDRHLVPLGQLCVEGYDPFVKEFCRPPEHEFDMIVSTDVLEHIPEENLAEVFDDMLSYQPRLMFHVISNRKAVQILPDGTNAHKTVRDADWWLEELTNGFKDYCVHQLEHNEKNCFTIYFLVRKI